jgi:hypothetical protein
VLVVVASTTSEADPGVAGWPGAVAGDAHPSSRSAMRPIDRLSDGVRMSSALAAPPNLRHCFGGDPIAPHNVHLAPTPLQRPYLSDLPIRQLVPRFGDRCAPPCAPLRVLKQFVDSRESTSSNLFL